MIIEKCFEWNNLVPKIYQFSSEDHIQVFIDLYIGWRRLERKGWGVLLDKVTF